MTQMTLARVPQTLRPYQEDAVAAMIAALDERQRPIGGLATGLGKTTLIAEILRRIVDPYTQRALVIAHTTEIVHQIYERIADQFSGALDRYYGYMKPGIGLVVGDTNVPMARIVVATRQSLHKKRLEEVLRHGAFGTVVIDEAHHAIGKGSYADIVNRCLVDNPDLRIFGMTATPARADRQALGSLWDVIAYEMNIEAGIEQGYLAPMTRLRVKTQVDLRHVGSAEGDYKQKALASALEAENWLDLCVEAYETYIAPTDRLTLAFMPSVEMSVQFAQAMNDAGHAADHVDGETPKAERDAMLKAFNKGKLKVLSNFGVMCLDSQTEILTQSGWVGIDAMTYQHKVANWDYGCIFFDEPKFIVRRQRLPRERMVMLETLRRSIRVTEDHRMLFRKQHREHFEIVHAGDLVDVHGELPISGRAEPAHFDLNSDHIPLPVRMMKARIRSLSYKYRQRGMSAEDARKEARAAIESRHAMLRKNPDQLTLDECLLIGFWLGDGTRTNLQSGGVEYRFSQSKTYPMIIKWFDALLARLGVDVARKEGVWRFPQVRWSLSRGTGYGAQRRRGIYSLEPYLVKDGAEYLWGLNEDQFSALLQGFWYADGDHLDGTIVNRVYRIHNTNYTLLSFLQAIAVCRGWSCSITESKRKIHSHAHWKPIYRANFAKRDAHIMSIHKMQFDENAPQDERVWCVTSTTGNIITRRRGTVTVMGNTEGVDIPSVSAILMGRPTRSRVLMTQMLGRGTRQFPGKKDCLLVDMTVFDTKVVQAGTLLGKMKICPQCDSDIWAFYDVCPHCGYEYPPPAPPQELGDPREQTVSEWRGKGLSAEQSPLFENTVAAWYLAPDGSMSCALAMHEGGFYILPPDADGYYKLYRVPERGAVTFVARNQDAASLIRTGEAAVEAIGAVAIKAMQTWRDAKITGGQMAFLKKVNLPNDPQMGRGEASEMISHYIQGDKLKRALESSWRAQPAAQPALPSL